MEFADLKEPTPAPWHERPDSVILEGVVGSRAYGLAGEGSDSLGVFLAPSYEFFGLDDVEQTAKNPWADEVLHELGKFCRLALKLNPTVTEVLWLEPELYLTITDSGRSLVEIREAFLSAPYCRNAYLGYATSQFAKLKDRGNGSFSADLRHRTAKHARHLARLLVCGYGLWSTGQLTVRVDDPQWFHDFGDQVADGDLGAAEDMLGKYETLFAETATPLPAHADRERVDDWLVETRRATLSDVYSA